jgi:hypothetical protein
LVNDPDIQAFRARANILHCVQLQDYTHNMNTAVARGYVSCLNFYQLIADSGNGIIGTSWSYGGSEMTFAIFTELVRRINL